jgi:hypothetical protein
MPRRIVSITVKRVRLLLREVPLMLRSIIVDALFNQPQVELLDDDVSRPPLAADDVDVVLVGAADPHDFEKASSLRAEWPKSRILVVASSGRDAVMYELHPRKLALGDVSPRGLVKMISEGFALM